MIAGSPVAAPLTVIARLRRREEELIDAIFARVSGDMFERTGGGDARYMRGLRVAVGAAVDYGLQGIESDGRRLAQVPEEVLGQARRAARMGVSLETVMRRYVVGHTLLGELVVEEVERRGLPAERERLRDMARAQAAVLDRLLVAITDAYAEGCDSGAGTPVRRMAKQVRELLSSEAAPGRGDWAPADYVLDGWHVGLIALGEHAEEVVRALADALERPLLCVPDGERGVWAWFGGKSRPGRPERERALAVLGSVEGVVCACGEPGRGMGGWRRTHRQAQAALTVALRRPRALTRYAEVALLAAALADARLCRWLLDLYIVPLQDGPDALLRETLRTYLRTGRSVSSSAAALGVARSTVEGRLRTVEERLGVSLQSVRPELEIALQLDEIAAEDI